MSSNRRGRLGYEGASAGYGDRFEALAELHIRYVRVTGWPGELKPEAFTGRVVYSDLDTAISFRSSNEKLNRLAQNAFWGQRSNLLDMPTDCPQRDERLERRVRRQGCHPGA